MSVFRLAVLLGKTVGELNMSWREFLYWQAYLKLEPPDKGDNERTAAILTQITNMSGRALPPRKMVEPADFLVAPKTATQSMQDQIDYMKSIGNSDG